MRQLSKRKFLALAAPCAIAGLFVGMIVLPAVQASQLFAMSFWDSADWKLDGGTTLGFPAIEGWTPPSRVYFQSTHTPVQEYYSLQGSTQAYSLSAYCYTQVVHQIELYSYYATVEFYQSDPSPNLFCDWHDYRVDSVTYWAYQNGHWIGTGQIKNPSDTEIMRLNAVPAMGQITVYMQTEYALGSEPVPTAGRMYSVWN